LFWDSEGILLVILLERGAAVKQTLKKLKQGIKKVLPNRKINQVLLLDSVRLHTIVQTREAVATVWCTYRPYSPYLTLSARPPFQNFSTPCILNVNNTGAKQGSIVK
jgi:hypothetical protein